MHQHILHDKVLSSINLGAKGSGATARTSVSALRRQALTTRLERQALIGTSEGYHAN